MDLESIRNLSKERKAELADALLRREEDLAEELKGFLEIEDLLQDSQNGRIFDPEVDFNPSGSKLIVDGFVSAAQSDAYTEEMIEAGASRHRRSIEFMKSILEEQLAETRTSLRALSMVRKEDVERQLDEYL